MLLASAMFAIMGALIKISSEQGASLAQILLFRGVPSVALLLVWAVRNGLPIAPKAWSLHVRRNVVGVASMWMNFYSLSHLPLATAASLGYSSPLFIAGWMMGWGGARRDWVRIAAVVLGFLGVLAILRPSITPDQWVACLVGLGSGATMAIAVMQVRELGRAGEPAWRTVLLFSVGICLSSLAGLAVQGWATVDWRGYLALAGEGIAGMFGQLAMTRAFGHGAPLLTAALQYTTIIFAALIGMALWGDVPDATGWAGIGLIIAAGLVSTWRTLSQPAAAPAAVPKGA
jgi:S-adenosylmethionine uptake transporter